MIITTSFNLTAENGLDYVQNSARVTLLSKDQPQLSRTRSDSLLQHLVDALQVDGGEVSDLMLLPLGVLHYQHIPCHRIALCDARCDQTD